MKPQPFKVTPFFNPSGKKVWRVAGRIDGRRIRQNFSDEKTPDGKTISGKVQAREFARLKEIERLNAHKNIKTVATRLNSEQIHEAEQAFRTLAELGLTLTDAMDFVSRHYVPAHRNISVADAVDKYIHKREQDQTHGTISVPHCDRLVREMRRFRLAFKDRKLPSVTAEDLRGYLKKGKSSSVTLKSQNNRRGILSTFFKFALDEERRWIESNPLAKTQHYGRKALGRVKGEAPVLSAAEAETVMRHAESHKDARMVTYCALAMFAGVRPDWRDGEMSKIRPEHVNMDRGEITITPAVSKVGELRVITIQPNLRKWLEKYPLDRFPPVAKNMEDEVPKLRKKFALAYDVLRHTFCSHLYSLSKDLGDTARQAGNSTEMIRSHYMNYRQADEVTAFWAVAPKEDAQIVQLSS